jgi:hypothetical protein
MNLSRLSALICNKPRRFTPGGLHRYTAAYFACRLKPAGFCLAFAARGAMLTGEPFNRTIFGTAGIAGEPN